MYPMGVGRGTQSIVERGANATVAAGLLFGVVPGVGLRGHDDRWTPAPW
jgi:hypothetical protein